MPEAGGGRARVVGGAKRDGVVKAVSAKADDSVAADDVLVEFE